MVALTRLIYYTWEISRIFTILSSRIFSPLRHTLHSMILAKYTISAVLLARRIISAP